MSDEPAPKIHGLKWSRPPQFGDPLALDTLLQDLQLLATVADRKTALKSKGWDADTPQSIQAIKSGATAITKTLTRAVATAGGITVVLTSAAAALNTWKNTAGNPATVALILGAAFVAGSALLAIAFFVKGDLEARGIATAARHQGRAEVAAAFLRSTARMPGQADPGPISASQPTLEDQLLAVLSAFPGRVRVVTDDDLVPQPVTAVTRTGAGNKLLLELAPDVWIEADQVKGFKTVT